MTENESIGVRGFCGRNDIAESTYLIGGYRESDHLFNFTIVSDQSSNRTGEYDKGGGEKLITSTAVAEQAKLPGSFLITSFVL